MALIQIQASMRDHGNSSTAASSRPTGLLVAEDDETLRGVLARTFRKYGIQIWTAANGLEAVQMFHQYRHEIDLVLSDVQMPLLDGFEMLRMLRKFDVNVRCCLMSGDTRDFTLARMEAANPFRVFIKPFNLSEVVDLLGDIQESTSGSIDSPR